MNKDPKIVKSEINLSTPWFELMKKHVLFPGETKPEPFYSINQSDYVTILAQTAKGKIIIVKQYRPIVEDYSLELPSGHVDQGEQPKDAAIRELKEETNYIVDNPQLLGRLNPDAGRLGNQLWAFWASDARLAKSPPSPKVRAETERICEYYLVTNKELFTMIEQGKLRHSLDLSVIALAIVKEVLKVN